MAEFSGDLILLAAMVGVLAVVGMGLRWLERKASDRRQYRVFRAEHGRSE